MWLELLFLLLNEIEMNVRCVSRNKMIMKMTFLKTTIPDYKTDCRQVI